ncbi:MAG: transporter [Acidobacteria bacterium]|nr:transporter [Acidobacteriota bacterium]
MAKVKITNGNTGQAAKVLLLAFFFLISATVANSQQATGRNDYLTAASLAGQSQSGGEDEDFIKPSRPTVANPAEIQKAGVLQIEYGYDANFRGADFRLQQSLPLDIRFAAHSRFLLEAEIETVQSERMDEGGKIETGVGDTRLGFQAVALKDSEKHPALAFAYSIKIPTASQSKMLGTGRYDHRLTALLSKKLGENTDLDVNVAYLNVGREDSERRASGGLAAVSVSHEFENKFGFEAELSGNSLDDVQPKGVYALGALTYKVNKRLRFDAGVRFGLSNEAPRVGFFAGFTVGVADLFKKR